jgi:hypothetical protein
MLCRRSSVIVDDASKLAAAKARSPPARTPTAGVVIRRPGGGSPANGVRGMHRHAIIDVVSVVSAKADCVQL